MMSRRSFFRAILSGLGAVLAGGVYAIGYEPMRTPNITRYRLTLPGWPAGLRLTLAVLADIHACEPWMGLPRLVSIVEQTNALGADAIVLLGDYRASMRFKRAEVPPSAWARVLSRLSAPLGVHAILGNHDWWEDAGAQARGHGPTEAGAALLASGIAPYENRAARLEKDGQGFWLAGLADQIAILRPGSWPRGLDDLAGTLGQVTDDAPIILLAHEPDIFPEVPSRVALTLAGHTHGGQVRLAGWSPVVPSRYGSRYAYGRIEEDGRTMIVSGGLGLSILPVRLGVPPEIVVVELAGA